MITSNRLRNAIDTEARAAGFDVVRVMRAVDFPAEHDAHYRAFVAAGHYGDMGWMAETADRRTHPQRLWQDAKSVIVLGMNYGPDYDPTAVLERSERAAISCYAKGKDYHVVIKKALKRVAGWLHRTQNVEVKVFVDTAPVMEKPVAMEAGVGWQGKHTNLVSRDFGSWLFLGAIFTTAELEPDTSETDHCGGCRRCLDVCPTNAFPAPYQLDARRCISYLTIEHKGHIPVEFRTAMGNRIFGCDDCLAVCPWNKFAQRAQEQRFAARDETDNPPLAELLAMDDAAFRKRFQGTPVRRTGRERFMRNVLIAAGNSGALTLVPQVTALLEDPSSLVRAMAIWALVQLHDTHDSHREFVRLRTQYLPDEPDDVVRREWAARTFDDTATETLE